MGESEYRSIIRRLHEIRKAMWEKDKDKSVENRLRNIHKQALKALREASVQVSWMADATMKGKTQ